MEKPAFAWIGRLNSKLSVLPKIIYRFSANSNPCCRNGKVDSQIHKTFQGAWNIETIQKKISKVKGLMLHGFKTYYKDNIINRMEMA